MPLAYRIYHSVPELPDSWDSVAASNLFLTKRYFSVLADSAPENMQCYFIGIFQSGNLVGCALAQYLDMASVASFGNRDRCLKENLRKFTFRKFTSRILILGNNMFSGENAFVLSADTDFAAAMTSIESALNQIRIDLRKQRKAPHLIIWKDFRKSAADRFPQNIANDYFRFTAQPSMIFPIRQNWNCEADYVADLNKKYRDQYKRARKKASGVTMRQLNCDDILNLDAELYRLYRTVADNAPFNTFYLRRNHWLSLKENLGDDFLLYGYFSGEKLIGFDTLIRNGNAMETYFLGYDAQEQKHRMLYLNMLYNMIGYAIKKKFKTVIFARTALEIKSSVGAEPLELYGFMKHTNPVIQRLLPRLFRYFEPEAQWQRRHPFSD